MRLDSQALRPRPARAATDWRISVPEARGFQHRNPFPIDHLLDNRGRKEYRDILLADGPFARPDAFTHIYTKMALRMEVFLGRFREEPMMSAPEPSISKRLHPPGDSEELKITLIDITEKDAKEAFPSLLRPVWIIGVAVETTERRRPFQQLFLHPQTGARCSSFSVEGRLVVFFASSATSKAWTEWFSSAN